MPRKRGKIGEYTEEKCDELIELMAEGMLNCEIIAKWDISEKTFYRWIDTHQDFAEAYQIGLPKCEAQLVKKFRQMADGTLEGKHSFNALIALANNKFKWSKNTKEEDTPQITNNIQIGQLNVLQSQNKVELMSFVQDKLKELEIQDVDYTYDVKSLEEDDSE